MPILKKITIDRKSQKADRNRNVSQIKVRKKAGEHELPSESNGWSHETAVMGKG